MAPAVLHSEVTMLATRKVLEAHAPPQTEDSLMPLLQWTAAATLLIVALWLMPYQTVVGCALLVAALLTLGWLFLKL